MRHKRILIIGGSKGIGFALAKEAKRQNNDVFVISRTTNNTLEELQVNHILQDFNEDDLIDKTLREIKPEVLIICAAKGVYGDFENINNASIKDCCINTFVSPILWISRALTFLPKDSTICWISSLLGKLPNAEWAFYGASKAGVEHYIKSIETIAFSQKINLCVIYPGCVKTQFHKEAGTALPEDAVSADTISKEILSAIKKKKSIWTASMDYSCITDFNKSMTILYEKYGNTIK